MIEGDGGPGRTDADKIEERFGNTPIPIDKVGFLPRKIDDGWRKCGGVPAKSLIYFEPDDSELDMTDAARLKTLLKRRKTLMAIRLAATEPLDRELADIDREIDSLPDEEPAAAIPVPAAAPVSAPAGAPLPVDRPPENASTNDYLLWAIGRSGDLDFAACAVEHFGEDSAENRQRLHRALWHLKRTRRIVKSKGHGTWKLHERKRRGRPPKEE